MKRTQAGVWTRMLSLLVLSLLLVWPAVRPVSAHFGTGEGTFNVPLPSGTDEIFGVAATPDRLLVASCTGGSIQVWSLTLASPTAAAASAVAFGPALAGCDNPDVAIANGPLPGFVHPTPPFFPSRNEAGFHSNYVYVTQRVDASTMRVVELDQNGAFERNLVSVPCAATYRLNLAFGTTGWGSDPRGILFIACSSGRIWKVVDGDGTPAAPPALDVVTLGVLIEGVGQAPTTYTRCPGCLFISSPSSDWLHSLTAAGTLRRVDRWTTNNDVDFTPAAKCDFQTARGFYFVVVGPATVFKIPPAAGWIPMLGVTALVTRATGAVGDPRGIGRLDPDGRIRNFEPSQGATRGAGFLDCGTATIIQVDYKDNIPFGSGGLTPVTIFGTDMIPVSAINASSLTFGVTGYNTAAHHCDQGAHINNDNRPDLTCHVPIEGLGVPPRTTPQPRLLVRGTYTLGEDPNLEGFD